MSNGTTTIAGIAIPSTDPVFLAIVGVHVLLGIVAVISGAVAMLSTKSRGRHPTAGKVYFWSLAALALTAAVLSAYRWSEDYHLFILGALAFAAGFVGRTARRRQPRGWARWHILGMGSSYVLLLTAFYVDNGRNLPLWNKLPTVAYWLLPTIVGLPLILRALRRYASVP